MDSGTLGLVHCETLDLGSHPFLLLFVCAESLGTKLVEPFNDIPNILLIRLMSHANQDTLLYSACLKAYTVNRNHLDGIA